MPVKTGSPVPQQVTTRPMSTFSPIQSNGADSPVVVNPSTFVLNGNGYVSNGTSLPNGYVPNAFVSNGYVCNVSPPVRSGYLPQIEAFAVRSSLVSSPAGTPDDLRAKVPIVASLTDNRVISGKHIHRPESYERRFTNQQYFPFTGYVTHKMLSDFGLTRIQ